MVRSVYWIYDLSMRVGVFRVITSIADVDAVKRNVEAGEGTWVSLKGGGKNPRARAPL